MHLTWNKRSWASLSVGPPPVGGAPAQQAVAPEAQKKNCCLPSPKCVTVHLKCVWERWIPYLREDHPVFFSCWTVLRREHSNRSDTFTCFKGRYFQGCSELFLWTFSLLPSPPALPSSLWGGAAASRWILTEVCRPCLRAVCCARHSSSPSVVPGTKRGAQAGA